jgi:hypothetical protein
MSASQKSFFTGGTIIVPVGATVPYNCSGAMFLCKEASDLFLMSFNDGEFFPMEVGLGFRLNGTESFTKLSFYNNTQSIVTIEFFVGVGEIRDARLNTAIDRLVIMGIKDLTDYVKGAGTLGNSLTANGIPTIGNTYAGTDPATSKQRKQITFQNVDATAYLWIVDGSNLMLASLPPGQSWTMASSGTYKAVGANLTNCSYLVCQTFYTS